MDRNKALLSLKSDDALANRLLEVATLSIVSKVNSNNNVPEAHNSAWNQVERMPGEALRIRGV